MKQVTEQSNESKYEVNTYENVNLSLEWTYSEIGNLNKKWTYMTNEPKFKANIQKKRTYSDSEFVQ